MYELHEYEPCFNQFEVSFFFLLTLKEFQENLILNVLITIKMKFRANYFTAFNIHTM